MEEKSEISKLIELKKFEQPEDGFFDDFLADFQKRQRRELVEVSARTLFWERLVTSFKQWGSVQWSAVTALVLVVCALTYLLVDGQKSELSSELTDTSSEVTPVFVPVFVETYHPQSIQDVEFVFVDLFESSVSNDVEF